MAGAGVAGCSQTRQNLHGRGNVAFIVGALGSVEGFFVFCFFPHLKIYLGERACTQVYCTRGGVEAKNLRQTPC